MTLLGHDAVWRAWRAARAGARMHHGWMLVGREGLGKAAFAGAAAAELVAEPGVPQPDVDHHPDIHWLRPLPASEEDVKRRDDGRPYAVKRNISVDQVRGMQRRLITRPTLGSRRAVIIDAADLLEASSANALLKSLEEPPQGTFFLLVVHQPGRLLPTVRSRCQVLRFRPLEPDEMDRALALLAPEIDSLTREAAIAVGAGAPGAALAFASQDLGRVWQLMRHLVRHGDGDMTLRAEMAAAIGQRPDRERQMAALTAARMVVVEAMSNAAGSNAAGSNAAGSIAAGSDHGGRPQGARHHAALADAHTALIALAREAPIYNYDAGILMLEIGALLAGVAQTSDARK